jgi:hypothetical protein
MVTGSKNQIAVKKNVDWALNRDRPTVLFPFPML